MAAIASSPSTSISTVTTVIQVTDKGKGEYTLTELPSDEATFPDLHSGNRKTLDFPIPVPGFALHAYVDLDDKEIGAYATFLGTQIGGNYSAGLDTGVKLGINLLLLRGEVRIFRSGADIKGSYRLTIVNPIPFTDNQDVSGETVLLSNVL